MLSLTGKRTLTLQEDQPEPKKSRILLMSPRDVEAEQQTSNQIVITDKPKIVYLLQNSSSGQFVPKTIDTSNAQKTSLPLKLTTVRIVMNSVSDVVVPKLVEPSKKPEPEIIEISSDEEEEEDSKSCAPELPELQKQTGSDDIIQIDSDDDEEEDVVFYTPKSNPQSSNPNFQDDEEEDVIFKRSVPKPVPRSIHEKDFDEDGLNEPKENIIKTVGIKCPLPDCNVMISNGLNLTNTKSIMDHHFRDVHLRTQSQHVCAACFEPTFIDAHHMETYHSNTSVWVCPHCTIPKEFDAYDKLSKHHQLCHVEGAFACAKPNCGFVSDFRVGIYRHNANDHRLIVCPIPGCGQSFKYRSTYTRHNWVHMGLKQFRCKWRDELVGECGYGANTKGTVITHIRKVHMKLPVTKIEQKEKGIVDTRNPLDYVHEMCLDEAKWYADMWD